MKRRLVLARALVNDPDLIFLDEPTTGLDPQARRQLWDLIEEFKKAGRTILDANVTNMITAVVLFEYGTGPIKGFAVTLSVGILTSVFAALVVTRILYELYPGNRPVNDLSV